jgi:hypothetical protein
MFGGEKSMTEKVKEVLSTQAVAMKEALIGKDKEHNPDPATTHPADMSTMDKEDMKIADTHPAELAPKFDDQEEAMRDFVAMHKEDDAPFAKPMHTADDLGLHTQPDDLGMSKPEPLSEMGSDKRSTWEKAKDAVSDTMVGKAKDSDLDRAEVMGKEKYKDAVPVDDTDKENRDVMSGDFRSTMTKAKDTLVDKVVGAKDTLVGNDKENRPELATSMDQFGSEKFEYARPIGKHEAEKQARETGKMIDQTKGGIAEKVGHLKKSI